MDIKKDAEGFFSGTLSAGFKSASKYSYSSKYSFAKAEVTKKQRKYFVDADVELLSRYLSSNFVSDLGKYSAYQIVAKYGTHVLTNITVVGSYIAYYKSVIVVVLQVPSKSRPTLDILYFAPALTVCFFSVPVFSSIIADL